MERSAIQVFCHRLDGVPRVQRHQRVDREGLAAALQCIIGRGALERIDPTGRCPGAGGIRKLLKVQLTDGGEEWMLVHIEIQGRREAQFPQRMFTYAYRLYDRYAREIASLAVLADTSADWRPDRFEIGRWGSRLGIRFPSVKLLDYASRQAELETEENLFATVVLAHLAAQATRGDARARYSRKLNLTRRLYERGLSRQRICACNTAMGSLGRAGSGAEVESFGALAQLRGARGVLATLWPVADESTGRLMQRRYAERVADPHLTKAEALRRAQLALLRGEIRADPADDPCAETRRPVDLSANASAPETRGPATGCRWGHPYYWAPFVLMGNWL